MPADADLENRKLTDEVLDQVSGGVDTWLYYSKWENGKWVLYKKKYDLKFDNYNLLSQI